MKDKEEKKVVCLHEELHFERGGAYIVCSGCGDMWRAVVKPNGIVVDVMARSQGLNKQDIRKSPSKA
jgi:hypothetical protein